MQPFPMTPPPFPDRHLRPPVPRPTPITLGRYGSSTRLMNSDCSGPCTPGYYCPTGSNSSTAAPCGGVAWYCPLGTGSPVSVPVGFYSLPEDLSQPATRSSVAQCQPGQFCVAGGRAPCPGGTYNDTAGRDRECSTPCPAGGEGGRARALSRCAVAVWAVMVEPPPSLPPDPPSAQ